MSNSTPRPVRYVVFHKPGPKWQYGGDFKEQEGVGEHVQYNFTSRGNSSWAAHSFYRMRAV